jgi:hypothetical protein
MSHLHTEDPQLEKLLCGELLPQVLRALTSRYASDNFTSLLNVLYVSSCYFTELPLLPLSVLLSALL